MIELKDISGNTVLSTPVNEGSKKRYTLMKEDSVTLRFSLETPIAFQIGTYIDDSEIGLYELTDIYNPAYNTSTGAYDYELRLDAYYFKWKNKIFKYTPENGGQEASWNLTAPLDVQMGVFLRNLSALGYTYKGTAFTFSIDSTVENSAKLMSYENTNMLDALSRMAEAWECEWWVTDNVIHFGRCEYGTAVDFEAGKNVEEMASSGNRSTYATRIYAFGGTRNLPANYRPTGSGVTVNGVVQKRLMLPEGTPYIDAYPNMPTEQAVEQIVVFDDVYPRTNGSISSVSTYESSVNNEDGTQSKETFYRFTDNGITFSKDYMLENEELHVIFQSGSLNGMDFGVRFNPDNVPEKLDDGSWNPEAQLWEIVANEDYGRKLPDGVLNPEAGDTYVLYGWDSTKIADLGLVDEAERELKRKAEKYVEKSKIDPNTYQCRMMPDYMYGLDGNGNQNPNYAKRFDIGDRVNLINPAFFETGSRQSRIIGYELSLDMPYDSPVYSIGETAAYSRIGSIEEKVNELTINGQKYTGGNGSGASIYVIGTNDTTPASNRNVYSAYRSQQEFLNKRTDDRSVGKIASDKGFEVGNYVSGSSGGIFYVDKETGHTRAELDKLYVRMKAYFESLEIVNVNSIGGKQVISPAGAVRLSMAFMPGDKYVTVTTDENGKEVKVESTVPSGVYRCMFLAEQDGQEVENRFKAGDQLQSKDFNITKPGEYNQVTNHYYWRLVTGVSSQPVRIGELGYHYVDLSVADCDTGSDSPAKGDVIAHLGNRNDVDRQNALVFSSVDTFSPSITLYQGINSYSYLGKDVVSYGVDKTSGKAFFNVYGDMYIGDRDNTSYVRFRQGSGMKVKGDFAIDSTIGGKDITEYIKEHSGMTEEEVTAIVKSVTDDLQNQIDGTVETHFFSGAPSLSNPPASGWVAVATETNNETYDKHVGDLYYDKDTGYGYRFMKDGETYVWELLKDTDVTKALADAAKAQETADGKMKVFDHQPTDAEEYEVGDIWVNATYGDLYSNEILRAVTAKAVGAPFNIGHWTKASKYTDDSKAEQVQANVDALSTTVNTMSTTVNGMKDFTDEAFSDGIVDRSEKSAIENYLNNIDTTKAEVVESYGKVYGNSLLEGVAKTNLANAYTAFGSAVDELKTTINGAIADGVATSIERASVDQKYTNFNTKYGEFIAYLNAANKYIQDKINATANNALEKFTSLEYLKAALKENTEITGGLIQSSMLALGYTTEDGFTVMSGTNGIYDASKRGGGIASWWGGGMFDRFDYTEANMPANVATGLVRFDGTGYFAKGNLWWDVDGRIHADPQSFIINENQLGDYLELFQIIYRGNTKDIDYVIPQYPMQSLEVATEIRIGNGLLKWDEANQGFYVEKYGGGNAGFYATSYLSAKGANPNAGGSSGGGLIQSVYGYSDLGGTFSNSNLADTFNAYTINEIDKRLRVVESGSLTSVDWGIITGKPTTISGYGITDGVTLNTAQTITGKKTFNAGIAITSGEENPAMPFFLGIDAFVKGGTVKWITASKVANAINVYTKSESDGLYPTKTGEGASGTWGINITGSAPQLYTGHISNNGSHADALHWYFDNNKASIPRNVGLCYYSNAYNNGSQYFGYFLNGNDSRIYGGFFVAHYENPYYVGIANGIYSQQALLTITNYSAYLDSRYVNAAGDTMTGTLIINAGGVLRRMVSDSGNYENGLTFISKDAGNTLATIGYHNTSKRLYLNSIGASEIYRNAVGKYSLCIGENELTYNTYTLWHAGNDGSGSGLNADLLDGYHATNFITNRILISTSSTTVDANNVQSNSVTHDYRWSNTPIDNIASLLDLSYSPDWRTQIFSRPGSSAILYVRHRYNGTTWTSWKQLAFIDSNVASATKLQTERTIWGQSFNGEQNVRGELSGTGNINFNSGLQLDIDSGVYKFGTSGQSAAASVNVGDLLVSNAWADRSKVPTNGIYCLGSVGIGISPSYKLHVAGDIFASSGIYSNGIGGNGLTIVGNESTTTRIAGKIGSSAYAVIARYEVQWYNNYARIDVHRGGDTDIWKWSFKYSNTEIASLGMDGTFWAATGIFSNGYVSAKGQNQSSDMRLKVKLSDINLSAEAIANAPSFLFTWKSNGWRDVGSSAQYWMNVLPDAVKERDGYYEMGYGNIALLSAISLAKYALSIATRTETLEEKVNRLEKENNDMRIQIEELERRASA